jgi:hypothetical protein
MDGDDEGRLEFLRGKLAQRGLSDDEVRELADLERGGPPPFESKIRPWTPPIRPWHRAWWRDRSLTAAGGLMVVVLIMVAVVIAFRHHSAVSWRVYPDTRTGFTIDYPDGWVAQPIAQHLNAGDARPVAQDIVGVIVSMSGREPTDMGAVFQGPVTEPFYGLVLWTRFTGSEVPAPGSSPVEACRTAGVGGLHQSATQVTLGGLQAAQFESTVRGVVHRDVCAFRGSTLVRFFARVPVKQQAATGDVIEGAQRSVSL